MLLKIGFLLAFITVTACHTFQTLFPEQNRLYTYEFKANVSTGVLTPIQDASYWILEGILSVQVYDDFGRARLQLSDLKTLTYTRHNSSTDQSSLAVKHLTAPFEVDSCFSSIHVYMEPVWVTNVKRALTFNLLLAEPNGSLNSVEEPCVHGSCVWVYSRVGSHVRKYCAGVASRPAGMLMTARCGARVAEWRSRTPIDTDPNYLMTAERDYYLTDKIGLERMRLKSEFQYKTHNHILSVMTDLSVRYEDSKAVQSIRKLNLTELSIHYAFHNYSNPSNGIWEVPQDEMKNRTYQMLLRIAKTGIDSDNIVRNASFIHSLDFIELLNSMSQLNFASLAKLFEDVLGTSYELETARNIFLEVLPYVRSEGGAKLIKHLVVDLKNKIEDAMLVSLIRKLPYSIGVFSKSLLEELEVFTKLGPDFPQHIRHAAILSFATMVNVGMETDFDQQYFDDIYDKYLRMYNYCPQYIDRLVWLQGLSNIGAHSAHYLDEIYADSRKERHERLWASIASVATRRGASLENTLPILMNETEHVQLRVMALHAILTSPLGPRDFFNVHNYLKDCNNDQLKRFWYTTMKSLENNRFYDKYKSASYYIPFLAAQMKNPGLKEWATNNYIISQEPTLDVQGPTFQLLTVGGAWSGPPELVVVEFSTGGELSYNGALYIVAEGVTSNIFQRIQRTNSTDDISENLLNILKELKVMVREPEKVHIDIVIKVYDKVVYITHIDQKRFDSWNTEEVTKAVEDFVRFGSHINQQIVYYPTQMVKHFPTEIGTPVRLQSTLVSFTSIRGNLTSPSTDNLTWRNDLHIRYQGTSVTSLSIDGPLQPSEHTARLQQSMVIHLPMKFDVKISPENRSLELKWTNPAQNGGVALHSRTQIATVSKNGKEVHTIASKKKKQKEHGIFFDCENPMTTSQISRHLTSRNYNIINSFRPAHIILNSIRLLTSPPSGSCGVILPPIQLQQGYHMDVVFRIDEWSDEPSEEEGYRLKMNTSFGLDYYRETEDGKSSFFAVKGALDSTWRVSGGDNEVSPAHGNLNGVIDFYQDVADNFSICLSASHQSLSPFNIDFIDAPAAYKGVFTIYTASECKLKEQTHKDHNGLDIQYVNKPYGNSKRELTVRVKGMGVAIPNDVTDLDQFNLFGYLDALVYLAKNIQTNGSDFASFISVTEEDDEIWVNWGDQIEYQASSNAWLPPSLTAIQMLKQLGFYHECRVNHTIEDLERHLLIGDCTNKPRYAIIKSYCESCDKKSSISIEGGYPHDYFVWDKVKIESLDLDLNRTYSSANTDHGIEYISRSKLTGVLVNHSHNETIILVPQAYMETACGVCVDHALK